jgi:hypothetical protein
MLVALSENGTPCELYAVHGHYADAGEVAALMSSTLGVDMVMTGHSLGRNKLEHLLGECALLLFLRLLCMSGLHKLASPACIVCRAETSAFDA